MTVPIHADLRALWDERYSDLSPVTRREPRAVYDYLIAFGLMISGVAMGLASLTI